MTVSVEAVSVQHCALVAYSDASLDRKSIVDNRQSMTFHDRTNAQPIPASSRARVAKSRHKIGTQGRSNMAKLPLPALVRLNLRWKPDVTGMSSSRLGAAFRAPFDDRPVLHAA
jgi:hypothetical protein